MLCNGSSFTVTVHVAVLSPTAAVITAVPSFSASIFPSVTVATAGLLLVHVTSFSSASSGLYVTESFSVFPLRSASSVLFKEIDFSGLFTVTCTDAVLPSTVAVIVAVPFPTASMLPD